MTRKNPLIVAAIGLAVSAVALDAAANTCTDARGHKYACAAKPIPVPAKAAPAAPAKKAAVQPPQSVFVQKQQPQVGKAGPAINTQPALAKNNGNQAGGKIVASGAGNIVASGAGNAVSKNGNGIISTNGGGLRK